MEHVIREVIESRYFLGLDLGQVNDYTALIIAQRSREIRTGYKAIADRTGLVTGWRENKEVTEALYDVRHIERIKLGTPYPDVVKRVIELTRSKEINNNYLLAIDHTGVGRPIYDLFKKAGLETLGITITGGSGYSGGRYNLRVAKRLLVSTVQAVMQTGRLKFASGMQNLEILQQEMLNFRVKITESANEIYTAREGEHDDLVLALAMALWAGEQFGKPEQKATQTRYYR